MFNERTFIASVEAKTPQQFAETLRTAGGDEQRALRAYFGAAKFQRLVALAQRTVLRGGGAKLGNVVIIPGILGSELIVGDEKVWFSFWSIVKGDFDQLQVSSNGASVKQVSPSGLLRRYYGELEQYLLKDWNVLVFPYDWRLSIRDSADLLAKRIEATFGSATRVHLVAHSLGGLVTRSLAQRRADVWSAMGKLVMLGTPNYGSLAIPQLYTGLDKLMRIIALVDCQHDLPALLQFAKMFVGTYQMLPRTDRIKGENPTCVMKVETYGKLMPPQDRFDDSVKFQDELERLMNPERLVYIAGTNRPTADGIADPSKLDGIQGYTMTQLGDGTVPHSLGRTSEMQTYFVEEEHSALPENQSVMQAVAAILAGESVALPTQAPAMRGGEDSQALRDMKSEQDEAALAEVRRITARLNSMRGSYDVADAIAPEEQRVADLMFLQRAPIAIGVAAGAGDSGGTAVSVARVSASFSSALAEQIPTPEVVARLRLNICCGPIQNVGTTALQLQSEKAVDAIAVGHYIGVQPVFAELSLDEAISHFLHAEPSPVPPEDVNGIITQFTQRGIIEGSLGRSFFLPDPRDRGRIIAIAGMGPVGRFGTSELTLLARELGWSLGSLGKKHLATVLIGAGSGNLETEPAVRAWLRGVSLAILNRPDQPHIEELTFVETNVERAENIRVAANAYRKNLAVAAMELIVTPDTKIEEPLGGASSKQSPPSHQARPRQVATRLLVEQETDYYRFSAVTEDASFPERAVRVNPQIATQINNSLAAEATPEGKKEWGESLFKLLTPQDFQSKLAGSEHVVLACDSNVAQLHWELMVGPESAGAQVGLETAFLGLSPGITRQLRSYFLNVPEPPPPSSRCLRVLIVADTQYEHPLPAAAEEGRRVEKVFEQFEEQLRQTGSKTRIEVEALIGPCEATCAQVLKRLLKYPPYDVLHFSGHCKYEKEDWTRSGWLFSDNLRLTANELSRVDRVPAFVFSNACESGVTPSRLDLRTPELAPSFAEAFFSRGVKNFVCTAWPVPDDAAALFAEAMYGNLLGAAGERPTYIYEAMMKARRAIWQHATGCRAWGAYQHYGNPWFRLL